MIQFRFASFCHSEGIYCLKNLKMMQRCRRRSFALPRMTRMCTATKLHQNADALDSCLHDLSSGCFFLFACKPVACEAKQPDHQFFQNDAEYDDRCGPSK